MDEEWYKNNTSSYDCGGEINGVDDQRCQDAYYRMMTGLLDFMHSGGGLRSGTAEAKYAFLCF